MTKIIVDIEKLSKYSKELDNESKELSKVIKRMREIVDELEYSWSGSDATNFKNNANDYINSLKKVEYLLLASSEYVKNNVTYYDGRISKFNSILGDNKEYE